MSKLINLHLLYDYSYFFFTLKNWSLIEKIWKKSLTIRVHSVNPELVPWWPSSFFLISWATCKFTIDSYATGFEDSTNKIARGAKRSQGQQWVLLLLWIPVREVFELYISLHEIQTHTLCDAFIHQLQCLFVEIKWRLWKKSWFHV